MNKSLFYILSLLIVSVSFVKAAAAPAADPPTRHTFDNDPTKFKVVHSPKEINLNPFEPGNSAGNGNSADKGNAKPGGGGGGGNGISYHGGPLMKNTVIVYVIWYGTWPTLSTYDPQTIITDFLSSLGGTPWYNIVTTYYDSASIHLSNTLTYGGSTTDNYSQGTSLSDAQIQTVVSTAITSGKLPKDANGIYLVLTSADVTAASGFCTQYCGWHTYATIAGTAIKYGFIGNPDRCPSSCAAQTVGPNGNAGADGMVSVIAHEIVEAASDPQLNAWYDGRGYENADKCAWKFGTTYTVANGAKANVKLGSRDFLIQQNWVNANGGYCALKY